MAFPVQSLKLTLLDFQHRLSRMSHDGKLGLAPISEDVKYVLDIATGTGIWAIEFGLLDRQFSLMKRLTSK